MSDEETEIDLWIVGVVVALFSIAYLVLFSMAVGAEDEGLPYLRVSTPRDLYETTDRVDITIESKVWTLNPVTGNVTLAPSRGVVNVSLYDARHDVVLYQFDVPLFDGRGTYVLYVEPIWSSAIVEVLAVDAENLLSGWWSFRTQYSQEYLLYVLQDVWMRDDALEDARQQARRDADVAFAWATATAFAVRICVVFGLLVLRADQMRADDFGVESWKERGLRKLRWPPTFVPDDAGLAFDPERAAQAGFDVAVADAIVSERIRGRVRTLERIVEEIEQLKADLATPPAPEDVDADVPPSTRATEG